MPHPSESIPPKTLISQTFFQHKQHTKSLTIKKERGQLGTTPCRSECAESRVSHSILQPCGKHHPVLCHRGEAPHTLTYYRKHTKHSLERVREVSRAPHPAEASALSPASVTSPCSPASTTPILGLLTTHPHSVKHHRLHSATNQHAQGLTAKSERGQICTTPNRSKCNQSPVRHTLAQICTQHHKNHKSHQGRSTQMNTMNPLLFLAGDVFLPVCQTGFQKIEKVIGFVRLPTITDHTPCTPQKNSPSRVRDVSCSPHPAKASALSPESVTPSFNPTSKNMQSGMASQEKNTDRLNTSLNRVRIE